MVGSAALYQVAIALIPALLFGGATLQLREEGPSLGDSGPVGVVVAIVIAAGVVAEIVAIRGVIDPTIDVWEQRYLVLVLTLGTAAVAYWFAAPLLTDNEGRDHVPYGRAILAGLLAFAAGLGQFAITDSLHRAEARAQFDEASKRHLETLRELRTAEGGESNARARLIALARSVRSSDVVVRVVVGRLGRLDDAAPSLTGDEGDIDAVMRRAFAVLNNVDDYLERSFRKRIPGLDEAERELLLLAERQVISAVALEMTNKVNDALARQSFERACEKADAQHCGEIDPYGKSSEASSESTGG